MDTFPSANTATDAQEMEQSLVQGAASAWQNKRKGKRFLVEVTIVEG